MKMNTITLSLIAVWHQRSSQRRFIIFPFLFSMLLVSGCKNPCKELADKVCSCKGTLAEQHACQTDINARKRFYEIPRTENEQECQRILDAKTCTCKALDIGQIEGCGMTRDLPTTQDNKQTFTKE